QWRIKSEIMEKQRSVTHADIEDVVSLPSSTTMATRARCVLAKSRNTLLAIPAVSTSGVQMTRFNTLVRTWTFAPVPVRRLSRDMLHKEVSVCSTSSMRTHFPAQGKRIPGPFAVSFAMLISHFCKGTTLFARSYGRRHRRPSRQINSSAACGPQEPDS